jgi:hypothetical protein
VPDRLCVFPGGRIVFVELKRAGGVLSKLQRAQIDRLLKLQQTVLIIYNKEGVDGFIKQYAGQSRGQA